MLKEDLNNKCFLDEHGYVWTTFSPAGTGKHEWWAENNETGQRFSFNTNYVIEKIKTFESDVKKFEEKEKIETDMWKLIVKLAENILRHEILDNKKWSKEEMSLLFTLMKGDFEIKLS